MVQENYRLKKQNKTGKLLGTSSTVNQSRLETLQWMYLSLVFNPASGDGLQLIRLLGIFSPSSETWLLKWQLSSYV